MNKLSNLALGAALTLEIIACRPEPKKEFEGWEHTVNLKLKEYETRFKDICKNGDHDELGNIVMYRGILIETIGCKDTSEYICRPDFFSHSAETRTEFDCGRNKPEYTNVEIPQEDNLDVYRVDRDMTPLSSSDLSPTGVYNIHKAWQSFQSHCRNREELPRDKVVSLLEDDVILRKENTVDKGYTDNSKWTCDIESGTAIGTFVVF